MSKKSIRFYNDYEVRAVWDEENSKWWFSATDIVRAINDEEDYKKAGNYWRWLKKKMTEVGVQLVSVTHDFKFQAPDGKQRAADVPMHSSNGSPIATPPLTDRARRRLIILLRTRIRL